MTKDLGLAQDAATASRSPIPLGSIAHQTYRMMSSDPKYADKDFSKGFQSMKPTHVYPTGLMIR